MNVVLRAACAVASALIVSFVFVAIAGGDPSAAARAFLAGAVGDPYAISQTLARATPLLVSGLAVALAFRAGVFNIGAEGQMTAGASAAVFVGLQLEGVPAPIAITAVLLASAAGGAAAASIAALFRALRGVPEVLTTILLNFIFAQFVSWLVRGPLKERSGANPQSDSIAASAMLPRLLESTSLHSGFLLAIAAVPIFWFFLYRTAAGFRLRAAGEGPRAARFAGFSINKITNFSLVASGALAGLSGGMLVSGHTGRLFSNISGGAGYVAIAVAMLGNLHPFGIAAAALFFGALEAGAGEMQRSAGVSNSLALVVEAASLLAILILNDFAARRSQKLKYTI